MLASTVWSLLSDEDDLRDVKSAVANLAGRWKDLGISLGIRSSKLDINFPTPSDCLREMLALWLRQSYNVRTTFILHSHLYSSNTLHSLVTEELWFKKHSTQTKLKLQDVWRMIHSTGAEVWKAYLEKTGRGCEGWFRGQQSCSGPENHKRSLWWVSIFITMPCQ